MDFCGRDDALGAYLLNGLLFPFLKIIKIILAYRKYLPIQNYVHMKNPKNIRLY